ncbi:hypothetical protein [Bartonella henselae]|uniref:hypothetical protein n=1 Tax=Bartonella henselae TaxID=38323 RepID=UPI0002D7E3C3|nr:hypothetical protein [Bartonella henselae]ATP12854.1 hypothetical protein BhenCHDE101_07305 [Bartonella henselae]ETS06031.1 hypothetical protein Q654_01419 [Bartonella henselae JK 50]ETS06144.1 hypothetical protein Q655_01367 [Bartonella henselae JK 51]MDM9991444.1 hypothetical protein [Bartonella henselae]OLL52419.1 hypothetical protein AT243_04405 [Bartonella henselae]
MRCEEVFGKELLEEDLFWGHWGGVRAVCGGKVFLDAGVIGVVDVPAHHDALAKVLVCFEKGCVLLSGFFAGLSTVTFGKSYGFVSLYFAIKSR